MDFILQLTAEPAFCKLAAPLLKQSQGLNLAATRATIDAPLVFRTVPAALLLFFAKVVHVFIILYFGKKSRTLCCKL